MTVENSLSNIEILFWQIFKNDYLKNLILSFIKKLKSFKYGIYKNDEIYSVEWMIKNGYQYLLWHKVINGEYLVFSNSILKYGNCYKKDEPLLKVYYEHSIFNVFKNDIEFFKKLLLNYPLYFKPTPLVNNNSITLSTDLERFAIEYDNQALIQVLVEEYQHKVPISSIEYAIDKGSFQVAYYLLVKNKHFEIKPSIKKTILKRVVNSTFISYDYNILNQKIDYLVNRLNIDDVIGSSSITINTGRLFDFLIYRQKLKLILECCYTIVYLKQPLKNYINSFSTSQTNINTKNELKDEEDKLVFDQLLNEPYEMLNRSQLDEIKQSFIEMDLLDKIVGELPSSNENVKSLFNMLIMFTTFGTKSRNMFDNFLFYKAKYYQVYGLSSTPLLFSSYKFGHFKKEDIILNNGSISCFAHKNQNDDSFKIFEYSLMEPEKQKEFIKQVCNYSKTVLSTQDKSQMYLLNTQLLMYCINVDNFELLELSLNLLSNNGKSPSWYRYFNVFDVNKHSIKIQSPKVFDILYSKFPIIERVNEKNEKLVLSIEFQTKQLIQKYIKYQPNLASHFKKNYPKEYENCMKNYCIDLENVKYGIESVNYINCAKFIFENWSDFKNYHSLETTNKIITDIWKYLPLNINQSDFEMLITNTNNSTSTVIPYTLSLSQPKINVLKQTNYLLLNRPEDIKSGRYTSNIEHIILCQYLNFDINNNSSSSSTGSNDDPNIKFKQIQYLVSKYKLNVVIYSLRDELVKRGEIKVLELLLSQLIKPDSKHLITCTPIISEVKQFFYSAVCFGNIKVLKFLFNSYKWIFNNSGGSDADKIDFDIIYQLFDISISNGNIDIISLLINEFTNNNNNNNNTSSSDNNNNNISLQSIFKNNNFKITNNNFYLPKYFKINHSLYFDQIFK